MPQAVAEYVESKDLASVDRTKRDILELYKGDIANTKIGRRKNICPIEVKSGKRYTTVSLDKFRRKYSSYLNAPYVLHTKDLEEKDGVMCLPLYMTPFL